MRQWVIQFIGGILLMAAVWAFLNTPDQRAWQVGVSTLLALVILSATTWLAAENFGGKSRHLARVFGCLLLLVGLLWLAGLVEDRIPPMATWMASALSHQRKKAVTPEAMQRWLGWTMLVIRWILLPLLLLPLTIRATGAKPARFHRLALAWVAIFIIGAVIPHYIVHWIPKVTGFWPEILSAAARFLVAYVVLITAWVLLGRATREAVPN